MKISARTIYGIQALFEMALHPNLEELKSAEIAEAQGIPSRFLEQILSALKKNGLVLSARGRSGGYSLGRPAKEITLLDVVEALEGPIGFSRSLKKGSILSETLKEIEDGFSRGLKSLTIEELVDEKRKKDKSFIYSI